MRTRVKFCGITRPEDAEAAARLGADAIGLIFASGSPRFISPERAAMIRGRLPPFVQAVALFRDADPDHVQQVIEQVNPDVLQFHGREDAAFCARFGRPFMKAVPMDPPADLPRWAADFSAASALLLDAHAPGGAGGKGRTFDWDSIRYRGPMPLVLAGGLGPDNVEDAVRRVQPFAVDVSSGIESSPGIKDPQRMQAFMDGVRRADGR